jgi:hypothetical protein
MEVCRVHYFHRRISVVQFAECSAEMAAERFRHRWLLRRSLEPLRWLPAQSQAAERGAFVAAVDRQLVEGTPPLHRMALPVKQQAKRRSVFSKVGY